MVGAGFFWGKINSFWACIEENTDYVYRSMWKNYQRVSISSFLCYTNKILWGFTHELMIVWYVLLSWWAKKFDNELAQLDDQTMVRTSQKVRSSGYKWAKWQKHVQANPCNQIISFFEKAKDKERYSCHSIDAETACHLPLFHQQHSSFTCYFGKYHF